MKIYVIELHDANVRVFHGDECVCQSPGYALVNSSSVTVGSAAFKQAGLNPRQVNNQFWQRLSADRVPQKSTVVRHYADLAYSHLQHLAEYFEAPSVVVFAVPGSFTSEQLSLLTGIAQACSIQVVGLVDAAVAVAAASELNSGLNLVLDMQLHRTDITVLATKGAEQNSVILRERVESVNVGLVKLYDKWIQLIADVFIEQCRFDPLHNAATEQVLLLKLADWLAAISSSEEVVLDIESSGQRFQARLQTTQAIEQVTPIYRQLVEAIDEASAGEKHVNILVSEEASNLPGFRSCLPEHQVTPINAVSISCTQHFDFIRGLGYDSESASQNSTLRFVTALPLAALSQTELTTIESVSEVGQNSVVGVQGENGEVMKESYATPNHDVGAALEKPVTNTSKKARYPFARASLAFLSVLVSVGEYLLKTKSAEIEVIAISALIPAILVLAVINITSYGLGYLTSLLFKSDRPSATYKFLNSFHYILYMVFWFEHGNPLGR